jgi:beta-lactamase class A
MKKIGVIILVISLSVNIFLISQKVKQQEEPEPATAEQYKLLAKRIFIDDPNDTIINFVPLRTNLNQYVKNTQASVALYFEYLPTGVSIGVNDRNYFPTASLLKVPIAMATIKEINARRLKHDTVLTLKEDDISSSSGSLWEKGVGATISVDDAIKLALVESDNTAAYALLSAINPQSIEYIFNSLDLPIEKENRDIMMSAKGYSSILRSLYFSSSLPLKDSNWILKLLTESENKYQLVAGLPEDVIVAHKFGVIQASDTKEIYHHDCGIVYVPKRQYILCVMTKNIEENQADQIIRDISKMTYDYIKNPISNQ